VIAAHYAPANLVPIPDRWRVPGTQRQDKVCKLIDTTTCIGCKACEVACVEWNECRVQTTYFDNTYQTMPGHRLELCWNLIKFNDRRARRRQLCLADA